MVVRIVVSIVALFTSLIFLVLGNGMLGTVVALRLEIEGYETGIAGLVLALFSVGFVLGSIYASRVVRRVGHIRAFAVFGAIAAAAALIHPLHISVPGWMVLRLVLGFCIAGLTLIVESWINARATGETRGKLLATYMLLFYMAASGGQFLIALGDPALHHLFVFAVILICCSVVPVSLTRSPAPELEDARRMKVRELWRTSQMGVAGAFLSGIAMSAFSAVGPIYALQMGLEIEQIAAFMGIAILAAMALQWPVGYLSDFISRRHVLTLIAIAASVAAVAAGLVGGWGVLWMYASVAAFYGLAACLYPVALALTHDSLEQGRVVPASATFLLTFGAGTIAGPIVGGLSVTFFGPQGLFFFIAAAVGMIVLLSIRSYATQTALPVQEQTHCYGVAPVSTPMILELDPRNEEFEPLPEAEEGLVITIGSALQEEESEPESSDAGEAEATQHNEDRPGGA